MSNTNTEQENEQLQQLKGHRLGPYLSFNPVNRVQIWQWCSAMGDKNPLYLDDDYRSHTEFDRVVAPPAMMQMWTMRDFYDNYAPGSTDAAPYKVFDDMTAMGYPGNVAVSYDITFHRYLLEGERPRHFTTVVNISDRKTTGLGEGYFVTERVEYTTDDEQAFAEALITYFQYQPKAAAEDTSGQPQPSTSTTKTSAEPAAAGWQSDFSDKLSSQLAVGDALPELAIPINHRLVVGGAIATQDFIPVHHNAPAAQAAAMPDIFMNILTTSGLCSRYLSDWAGPASRLKKLKFNLMAPNLPGDCMTMQGQVKSIEKPADNSDDKPTVEIDFAGKNGLGFHVTGSAKIALSS